MGDIGEKEKIRKVDFEPVEAPEEMPDVIVEPAEPVQVPA